MTRTLYDHAGRPTRMYGTGVGATGTSPGLEYSYDRAGAITQVRLDGLPVANPVYTPGNIGGEKKIKEVIACAKHHKVPMRIGVNAGSLEGDLQEKYGEPNADAMVESALRHMDILDRHDFHDYKISLKASDVFTPSASWRR